MALKEIITMSMEEMKRLKVIHPVMERRITQVRASSMLDLSDRQIRRIVASVQFDGEKGVIHKLRGRPSNRKIPKRAKEKVLRLYQRKYPDFGATLATEKLFELEGIKISAETLRVWLLEAGLWQRRRKKNRHRRWRVRKECFGEMIQMDGSHHAWLEQRGEKMVLMGYIDDATGEVFGRFYDHEGTLPAMDSFKRYIRRNGLPISVYLDRHTTYKSNKKLSVREELEGMNPLSQFERALEELGIEVIHAYSPQAKGRIERLFGTLQDRLVKEMRLRGITTMEKANEFLEEYWPRFNKQFRVSPRNPVNAHVALPPYFNLDAHLCIKTERTVAKDNTIAHQGKLYQIETPIHSKKVILHQRVDGAMHIFSKTNNLKYHEIIDRITRSPSTSAQPSSWKEQSVMSQFI
ncbi:ISNCY family transposase [bacterium]|nr:ISNCY family transposase [bacterium]